MDSPAKPPSARSTASREGGVATETSRRSPSRSSVEVKAERSISVS